MSGRLTPAVEQRLATVACRILARLEPGTKWAPVRTSEPALLEAFAVVPGSHRFPEPLGTTEGNDQFPVPSLQGEPVREPVAGTTHPQVYFVLCLDRVKIGWTAGSADGRMRVLRTTSPYEMELVYSCPGTRADEQAFHARFAKQRVRGEWFTYDGPLEDFLNERLANSAH